MAEATGKIRFGDLGDQIQKLLRSLKREVSDEELNLLSTITVREMARIYDMMGQGKTPEDILAWLLQRAKERVETNEAPRREVVSEESHAREELQGEEEAAWQQMMLSHTEEVDRVEGAKRKVWATESTARLEWTREEKFERRLILQEWQKVAGYHRELHRQRSDLQRAEELDRSELEGEFVAKRVAILQLMNEREQSPDFLKARCQRKGATSAEWLNLAVALDKQLREHHGSIITEKPQLDSKIEAILAAESDSDSDSGSEGELHEAIFDSGSDDEDEIGDDVYFRDVTGDDIIHLLQHHRVPFTEEKRQEWLSMSTAQAKEYFRFVRAKYGPAPPREFSAVDIGPQKQRETQLKLHFYSIRRFCDEHGGDRPAAGRLIAKIQEALDEGRVDELWQALRRTWVVYPTDGNFHKAQLEAFYKYHGLHSKLTRTDTIIDQFEGRYTLMWETLFTKYGPLPAPWAIPTKVTRKCQDRKCLEAELRQYYVAIGQEEKLANVHRTAKRYHKRVDILWKHLQRKYNKSRADAGVKDVDPTAPDDKKSKESTSKAEKEEQQPVAVQSNQFALTIEAQEVVDAIVESFCAGGSRNHTAWEILGRYAEEMSSLTAGSQPLKLDGHGVAASGTSGKKSAHRILPSGSAAEYKKRVQDLIEKYYPEKVHRVDSLMKVYAGKELLLLEQLIVGLVPPGDDSPKPHREKCPVDIHAEYDAIRCYGRSLEEHVARNQQDAPDMVASETWWKLARALQPTKGIAVIDGKVFSAKQCLLRCIACTPRDLGVNMEAVYQLALSVNYRSNEEVELHLDGKAYKVISCHLLEYLIWNGGDEWTSKGQVWKDLAERTPPHHGFTSITKEDGSLMSIFDCYVKAAELSDQFFSDLALQMDPDSKVKVGSKMLNQLQCLALAAGTDSDNWLIWSHLWVHFTSGKLKDSIVRLNDGTKVDEEACLRHGGAQLYATVWFSEDPQAAGKNYAARVAMYREWSHLAEYIRGEEAEDASRLSHICASLKEMAETQWVERVSFLNFSDRTVKELRQAQLESWVEILHYYRKIAKAYNAKVVEQFRPKFEALRQTTFAAIPQYHETYLQHIVLLNACNHEARTIGVQEANDATSLDDILRRLNTMNQRHKLQRQQLLDQAMDYSDLEEFDYMGRSEILDYYRQVATAYNAKIVALFRPKFEALEAEEGRGRQRISENTRIPYQNIVTEAKQSKKDVSVFLIEQGTRRFDQAGRMFELNYKTVAVKVAAKASPLPPALKYLIEESGRWALDYDGVKRKVVYHHTPSGLRYDDACEVLGIPDGLDLTNGGKEHPADVLVREGVWMEVPEENEETGETTTVYWNEKSNDTTYDLKAEWARPATAKPVMKEALRKKMEEEKKKQEAAGKIKPSASLHIDPSVVPPVRGGTRPAFLKLWNDEWGTYYFQNLRTNETTWDEPTTESCGGLVPNIYSTVKNNSDEFYLNERTMSRRWELPSESELLQPSQSLALSTGPGSPKPSAPPPQPIHQTTEEELEAELLAAEEAEALAALESSPSIARAAAADSYIQLKTEEGDDYFMNLRTGGTTWEKPPEGANIYVHVQGQDAVDTGDYYWNERTNTTRWDLSDVPGVNVTA